MNPIESYPKKVLCKNVSLRIRLKGTKMFKILPANVLNDAFSKCSLTFPSRH